MTDDTDIEAATDVLTGAAETAEATLENPTVNWDSKLGGACDKGYWERRAKANRLGLRALDALARERQEDAEDEADACAALAEPGPSIPYEQVRRELGLDDGERDKFQSCLRLTPAQIAAIDDGCYHQLDIFRDAKGVRWMLDGKDVP
jgi:hypothetical protein